MKNSKPRWQKKQQNKQLAKAKKTQQQQQQHWQQLLVVLVQELTTTSTTTVLCPGASPALPSIEKTDSWNHHLVMSYPRGRTLRLASQSERVWCLSCVVQSCPLGFHLDRSHHRLKTSLHVTCALCIPAISSPPLERAGPITDSPAACSSAS